MGVCFDTCHVWDAGYDIVNHLDEVLEEFDRVIGLDRLYAVHFNDSMNECGSHKDRHAQIGEAVLDWRQCAVQQHIRCLPESHLSLKHQMMMRVMREKSRWCGNGRKADKKCRNWCGNGRKAERKGGKRR